MPIHHRLNNIKWGTEPVEGYENARQINLFDPPTEQVFSVIFDGDPLDMLIRELAQALTDEQKQGLVRGLLGEDPLVARPSVESDPAAAPSA